jgi:hypothetical protein
MAYADLLDDEGINSQYLVVLSPRRLADGTTWSLVSGTIYKQDFTFGEVIAVEFDGVAQTKASSSALSDGTWYYDTDESELYVNTGGDPSSDDVVATYEIYLGTFDDHFHRDPLDSSTRVVYYEPLVMKSPLINSSATDALFGFLPSTSTTIVISNMTQLLQRHVYESSFNRAEIAVYHYLDKLTVANTKLVTKALCSNVSYRDNEITITVFDNNDLFNAEFRHLAGESFYGTTAFPSVDPNFNARPIRKVYGVVDGMIPVNIDYNATAPTSSNNRTWVVLNPETNLGSVSTTVLAAPASSATRTYLTSADGFRVGDSVWIDSALGAGSDEFVVVTAVNKTGSHYIDHAAVSTVAANPDVVKRSFVGFVTIVQDGVEYTAKYGEHYDEYTDGTAKVAGFTFNSALDSGGSPLLPNTLTPTDLVHCRAYGNTNTNTLGGPAFGSDSADTGNLTQAVVIIYEILKSHVGLTEAELDTAAFSSLQSSVADQVGLTLPFSSAENFPSFRDLLTALYQTVLFKMFVDDDNLFSLVQTGPKGAVDKTIEDDEILRDSLRYQFDYKDVRSDIFVEYAGKEVNDRNQVVSDLSYSTVFSTSTIAKRLHKIDKQKTFRSFHFLESEAQTLADRLRYAIGDRSGRIELRTKNRFFDSELNDVVKVSRDRMPGFAFVDGTDRDRETVVLASSKGLTNITLVLDDQKGIEDNSGSW